MIGFFLIATFFHYVNVPTSTMREKPDVTSEVASQALFSEEVHVIQTQNDWVEIETLIDHYKGWVLKKDLIAHSLPLFSPDKKILTIKQIHGAHVYNEMDTTHGPILTLPFESKLILLEEKEPNSRWLKVQLLDQTIGYIQRWDVSFKGINLTNAEMCEFSHAFIGKPYTWGGRSSSGYDCSGFIQMLLRLKGVLVPRDAKDIYQSTLFKPKALDQLEAGDLIFFGLAEDKIRHVGMYLKDGCFIHAAATDNIPCVHISKLTDPNWNGSGRYIYRAGRALK